MHSNDHTSSFEKPRHGMPLAPIVVAGHELTLFVKSSHLVESMVADIQAAKQRVWLESYIFANDAAGQAVATALAERAQAGLDVRVMVDAWGSFGTPTTLFNRMRAAGVRVHVFHAFGEALLGRLQLFRVLNQRNHRKLLIIDDRIAYFGGMNIVDQSGIHSKADAKTRHLPAAAAWRDVHLRLVGSRQTEIAASCARLWQRVDRQPVSKRPRWPVREMLQVRHDSLWFFDTWPRFKRRRPHRVLVPLIRQARQEITLSIAYFIPTGRVLRELFKARKRGVRVRIIVPGHSDVKVVQWAARHFYEFLIERGIRIYEHQDRMLHSKIMVVDGIWSVVGSCNFDARSLRSNLEFFAVIRGLPLAAALKRICLEDVRNSVRVDAAYCQRRSWWQRLIDRSAWSLRRWL